MGKIIIEGLEVTACHGVNAEEKVQPQRFVFCVEAEAEIWRAARTDSVDDTVSYSTMKKKIVAFATQNSFDLIETLADRTALMLLDEFDSLSGVTVTVKKPDAPMSGKFDYVAVTARRQWTRVYLALGSNLGDRDGYLDMAMDSLQGDVRFRRVKESARIRTAPYGGVAKGEFVNSAVEADTCCSPSELLDFAHGVEAKAHRERKEHWGDRTLDVDVIFFGDEVVYTDELKVPHPDMANRRFVLEPLAELAPHFVHPALGRTVKELLEELEERE